MSRSTRIILYFGAFFLALSAAMAVALGSLQSKISTRLEKGWVLPPLELYSQGHALSVGKKFSRAAVEADLQNKDLHSPRDFLFDRAEGCSERTGITFKPESFHCLWLNEPSIAITWDDKEVIQEIWRGPSWQALNHFALFPRLITQFFDGQPILQTSTPIAETPLACLQAVTAIEDKDFLEHRGVSATGIVRAVIRNLKAGRWAEGGSTITQQLVKNFFLSSKKTIRRKVEEQFLAVLLESQLNKDQILEMYLNVIYMGQSGPYQIRGIGAAAQAYFDKKLSQLNLGECALLAAIINSPGRFSPFERPEAARVRRELVLSKMVDGQMINAEEKDAAKMQALPAAPPPNRRAHAPYFVLSALKEFESLELDTENGARLFTTMDPDVQTMVTSGVKTALPVVEARVKKPSVQPLQVSVIVASVASGEVLGLIGGRDFRTTQYNRATEARRQIGSTVKPFVYYPALREGNPLTAVVDEPFEWKNHKNNWKPKNYDKKFVGNVPYFFALAQSLNIPAAKVGQLVGIDKVVDTLHLAGITSEIPNLPALTLGILETSPFELAQAYLSLARMGRTERLHTLSRVEDIAGETLYEFAPAVEDTLDPAQTAVLVGMMKQSVDIGTARAARALGLSGPYAGKTGTTSDTRDAWFVGFNSNYLMVVWVGYDDNTVMGLTGASAALPIWVEIAKSIAPVFTEGEFPWPTGVEIRKVEKSDLLKEFPALSEIPDEIELVFPDWAS